MVRAGVFLDRRTELIDGEVIDVLPQANAHIATVSIISRRLLSEFDESFFVTVRSPVPLPTGDIPAPNFAVYPGTAATDDNLDPLPMLVIEVSEETLWYDQLVKSSLYAANGIRDYWVVNVSDRQIEIYRDPVADATRQHGRRYASVNTFKPGTSISPLAAPAGPL
jgi:Uma2 family endonuclease